MNVDAASKFATLLGVQLTDFSPSLGEQAHRVAYSVATTPVTDDDEHAPPTVAIQLASMCVQAGIDGVSFEAVYDDDGRHHVPRQWLEENDFNPGALVAVKVKGESMQPLMFEGDIAVVNITDKSRKNGGIFAINYNGQAVIKRLLYERREWYLASENPEFKPAPCRGADCILIGRIVHFTAKNFRDRL